MKTLTLRPIGAIAKSDTVDPAELIKSLTASTPAMDALRVQMEAIDTGAVDDAGVARPLTEPEQKSWDGLKGALDTEIVNAHTAQTAAVQKAKDREKLESLALLKSVGSTDEAFEVGTTTNNQMTDALLAKAAQMGIGNFQAPPTLDPGEKFIKSASYLAAQMESGEILKGSQIGVDTGVMMKNLVTSPSVGTTVVLRDQEFRRHALLDAITVLPTGSDTLTTHIYSLSVNAAAAVAEGAAYQPSSITSTTKLLSKTKVGTYVDSTVEALADHARMRALINSILMNGVRQKVEAKVATDLAAWSGLAAQAYSNSVVESLLKAKTAANKFGTATGILLADADYEALALTRGTANDHYISPGPFGPANFPVWGLPVYPTAALPAGFAYVGDLSLVSWNERTPITVSVGWRGDQFIEDEITIKADQRGMTDVMHNLAVVKTDLTA